MDTLITARTIATIREVWWDIRPHPGFGTVELRICDGMPTLREVAVVAALSQCLVHRFDMLMDRGYTLPIPTAWVVRENKWRAARHGIDALDHRRRRGHHRPTPRRDHRAGRGAEPDRATPRLPRRAPGRAGHP